MQVPTEPATLQATQVPLHAKSQHLPLAQKPLAQVAAVTQSSPAVDLHSPAPSQTLVPVQTTVAERSRSPFARLVQVPRAFAQDLHVPSQALSQQRPSTQNPLAHESTPLPVQVWPFFGLHAPAPLQALVPEQGVVALVSWVSFGVKTHNPSNPATLQDMHAPEQGFSQQRPSTQLRPKH